MGWAWFLNSLGYSARKISLQLLNVLLGFLGVPTHIKSVNADDRSGEVYSEKCQDNGPGQYRTGLGRSLERLERQDGGDLDFGNICRTGLGRKSWDDKDDEALDFGNVYKMGLGRSTPRKKR